MRVDMTSVWLCRENIFGHFISRLVQVTSYSFFKTSESSWILCVIPCSSLLYSMLFLVAFSSGDFKFRESCLTVTKFLWKSCVNRNNDGLKENIHRKANVVACLSCMKQAIRSVENSYLKLVRAFILRFSINESQMLLSSNIWCFAWTKYRVIYLNSQICILGRTKYRQEGCPWKDLAKCSSDMLVLGQ